MDSVFDKRRYLIPFRATLLPQIFTDVLVIGSGVAGMRASISAADHSEVIVVRKGGLDHSNTYWAQGGIAAVLDSTDSFDLHVQDTLAAGSNLCGEKIVRSVIEQAPDRIQELIDWGMVFDVSNTPDGLTTDGLALGLEGGHSRARIVHSEGDATGRSLAETLVRRVRRTKNIRIFDDCFVLDLITLDGVPSRCLGAITHHPVYGLQVIWGSATILAGGGCAQVFRESTNPVAATGDGLAMAYRAGAKVADMAFMQFHPTTLYVAGASRSLISEAVRGEGAYLIDRNGLRFMVDYTPNNELAPRDIVAKAILCQMDKTNFTHVFLDCRHLSPDRFAARFPSICAVLRNFDIDPAKDPIPVQPAAHYMIGGVCTDAYGRTNIRGLYACGEVACTGLHGANRLASNSLLEGLVIGQITGHICEEMRTESANIMVKINSDITPSNRSKLDVADVRSSLRSVMWHHVGIERNGDRLAEVVDMFDFWARYTLDKIFDERPGWEVQNLLLIGALITRTAQWRQETRGTHYRTDHPEPRTAFAGHDVSHRGAGEPKLTATIG